MLAPAPCKPLTRYGRSAATLRATLKRTTNSVSARRLPLQDWHKSGVTPAAISLLVVGWHGPVDATKALPKLPFRAGRCGVRVRLGSPPFAFQGAVGASGAVAGVELGHVLVGQGEIEDLGVFLDALAVGRLGQDDEATLQAPAQQHLCRGAPYPLRHGVDGPVGKVPAGARGL